MVVVQHAGEDAETHSGGRTALADLEASFAGHPIWKAKLLLCLSSGWASPEDLRIVEPVLAAAARTHRTCRSAFGDAGGDRAPGPGEDRDHPSSDAPTFALYFEEKYKAFCRERPEAEVAAFLAGGGLAVERSLSALATARLKAGMPAPAEEVRREDMPVGGGPAVLRSAAEYALSLHLRLLEDLYGALRSERVADAFERIQARLSLERPEEPPIPLRPGVGEIMLVERDADRDIEFSVERYPCTAETLDPRVVRIPPGKTNNLHKHAHETLFCFIDGTGEILVGTTWVPVKAGDAVFAPRWAMHQTRNTGTGELVLLAITDYYLTSRVYVGKYDKI
ncbi:cupin domain-containing protein [Arenibaculum sp.]|jgi:mannose-6-phosphate isomerase-like protein (cupin superfamily)|uniref:cupin domain-containing protein n=1 Tax=Arenibaculum sp. TaxID=2865862 RepID=UPI002E0D2DB1|nr:cupin domain-containing protein [Arenibaculum sp.]